MPGQKDEGLTPGRIPGAVPGWTGVRLPGWEEEGKKQAALVAVKPIPFRVVGVSQQGPFKWDPLRTLIGAQAQPMEKVS